METRTLLSRPEHQTLTEMTAAAISEAIRQGKYPPGSQLPPEMELMGMLRVSRSTLREALRLLEEQGLIVRRRGLGTFVSEHSIIKDLSQNFGITEMITQAGMTPGTLDETVRQDKASKHVAEMLDIQPGDAVLVVDRIRTAGGVPIVWTIDILPVALFGGALPQGISIKDASLYDYVYKQLGVRVMHGVATLRPVAANQEMAHKLNTRLRDPLLLLEQTDYDEQGRPVIYSAEYHLPDKITFVLYRKGPHHFGASI
ncbi:MAG: GntR family transcriptional regulator [Anaerolineae bacterium]|nr:GntR family transcriptional regulator [Anaerolineae bacterium]